MNSWQKICILFPLNRELLMCIYNSILSTRRFDWHHLQVGPFIHCYDINYIYETEWNQTDRSERARTTLRELGRPPSSQGREALQSSWSSRQQPLLEQATWWAPQLPDQDRRPLHSLAQFACLLSPPPSVFCSRERQRAGWPFPNHSDNYMKLS